MASIEKAYFYEDVLRSIRSMREDGMSFDEALKEFLERFERSLLILDWIEATFNEKGVRTAEKYQNAEEKFKNEPEGLLLWIANNLIAFEEQE